MDSSQLFVQYMMNQPTTSKREMKSLIKKMDEMSEGRARRGEVTDDELINHIDNVNEKFSFFEFEIRTTTSEEDGMIHYVLVNKKGDENSKFSSSYSDRQLTYFKYILGAIILKYTEEGCIPLPDALNLKISDDILAPHFQNLGETQAATQATQETQGGPENATQMTQATQATQTRRGKELNVEEKEVTLRQLVKEKWLYQVDMRVRAGRRGEEVESFLSVGVRTLLELREFLDVSFENMIAECTLCNERVFRVWMDFRINGN